MKKPSRGSVNTLTSEKLHSILKTKDQWKNAELLDYLMTEYTAYDKEGLGHRMRQILSESTKKGKIKKIDTGVYSSIT
jgi:hypothetical protein